MTAERLGDITVAADPERDRARVARPVVAGGVGYLAVAWFLRYIAQHRFTGFVIYRVLLGATLLVLVGAGTLPAHR